MVAGTSPFKDEYLTTLKVWQPEAKSRQVPKPQQLLVIVAILGIFSFSFNQSINHQLHIPQSLKSIPEDSSYTYYPNTSRIQQAGSWSFNYDANGNLISRGISGTWDTATNQYDWNATQGEVWLYSYDLKNRLVQVQHGLAGTASLQQSAQYIYDIRDLRVATVKPYATTYTQYDTSGDLLWHDDGKETTKYIEALGQIWAEVRTPAGGTPATFFHSTDHEGTTNVITDATGAIVWDTDYEAFGSVTRTNGDARFNASYTGKEFDTDTGLYYYNARFYDPTLGRFITEDPARAGGNWYEYGNDNPLRFVDPTGLEDVGISGANGELTKQTFQDNAFNKKAPAQPKESLQQPIGTLSKGNGVHTPNMGVMDFINMGNESLAKDGFGSESFGSASWSDVAGRDVSPGEKRSAALVAGLFDIATLGLGAKALPGTAPSSGAQYVFDAKAGQYRDLTNGQFISPKDLPWPGNNGFSGKPIDTPLTPGLMLDRLGSLKGEFAGLPGASASERGLPAGSEGRPYTQLQVLKPLTVPSGPAAPVPAFGATGGGTQFQFSGGIQQWIDSGHLGVVP
jgi:RHS repeat-associated protein